MASANLGPFSREMSISALLEALLANRNGETLDFELSKSEKFLFEQMKDVKEVDELQEYREINIEAQEEILKRWGSQKLGVIWLGGGMVTPNYPLLANPKPDDWHFWTDTDPKVVKTSQALFQKMKEVGKANGLSYDITLPQDIDKLNRIVQFLVNHGCEHLIFQCFGFIYVLTPQENYNWLSRLDLPPHLEVSFNVNASNERLGFPARFTAAAHNQRMMAYGREGMLQLFQASIPNTAIVWETDNSKRTFRAWDGWIIHRPAQ